jgi:acyl-CoA synthetase (AMP-forming)/AMP-acid ligase II
LAHEATNIIKRVDEKAQSRHGIRAVSIPSFTQLQQSAKAQSRATSKPTQTPQTAMPLLVQDNIEHKLQSFNSGHVCSSNHTEKHVLMFTSGTTSNVPKGVLISHTSLWHQSRVKLEAPCKYTAETSMIMTVPFFHIGGLSSIAAIIIAGGTMVFPVPPSDGSSLLFDPQSVFRSMAPINISSQYKDRHCFGNTLVVVPAMLHSLLDTIDGERVRCYPYVQLVLIGGQSSSSGQLSLVRRVFPNSRVVQTYACTEAASSMTFLDVTNQRELPERHRQSNSLGGHCVGKPPRGIRVGIFPSSEDVPTDSNNHHSESGSSLRQVTTQPFVQGYIGTFGKHVMSGYWRRNRHAQQTLMMRANRDAFPYLSNNENSTSESTWLKTNDLGYLDHQGQLFFCGRANDVIRTGGETVFPQEVEEVLLSYCARDVRSVSQPQTPLVDSCEVFPLSDSRFGEVVCAAVVLRRNYPLSLHELRQHCKAKQLAGYKCPRRIFITSDLPRNSSGKVLRHKLKEIYGHDDEKILKSRL